MNTKSQVGHVAFIFAVLFTILFLTAGGAQILNLWILGADNAGLTGLEAFIMHNPALWVFIGLILGTMGYFWFVGNR